MHFMPDSEDLLKDLDAYGRLIDLWAQENPIKTNKEALNNKV